MSYGIIVFIRRICSTPTEQAVQYVWERFVETFFTAEAQSLMQEVGSIQRALAHRPFNLQCLLVCLGD